MEKQTEGQTDRKKKRQTKGQSDSQKERTDKRLDRQKADTVG